MTKQELVQVLKSALKNKPGWRDEAKEAVGLASRRCKMCHRKFRLRDGQGTGRCAQTCSRVACRKKWSNLQALVRMQHMRARRRRAHS